MCAVQVPEAYEEPGERVFTPGENLLEWLTDKRGRDQFVLRCARCGCMLRCAALHCVVPGWDEHCVGKPAGCGRLPVGVLAEGPVQERASQAAACATAAPPLPTCVHFVEL